MQVKNTALEARDKTILGVQFVITILLMQLPYRASFNMLVQIGLFGIAALFYAYEPFSAVSSIMLFNILPTTINTAIHSAENATGVYYLGYQMSWVFLILVGIAYLVQQRNAFNISRYAWWCIGFGTYMLISEVWAWDTMYYSDTFFLLIGIYVVFPLLINSQRAIMYIWNAFILAGLLVTINMLIYTLSVGTIQQTGSEINSNYMSLTTMIILTLDISYLLERRNQISLFFKALILASIIGSAFLVISYASRTAFLLLIMYLLLMTAVLLKNNRRALLRFAFITIAAVYLIVSQGIYEYLASTFFEDNFASGNGRTILWAQYLREFIDESLLLKLFGRGFHVFRARFLSYDFFAHNSYFSILIDFGLLGLMFFILNASISILNIFRTRRYSFAIAMIIIQAFLFAIDGYQDAMCATFIAFTAGSASNMRKYMFVENK